jgi:CheY-like chemotaxis protein
MPILFVIDDDETTRILIREMLNDADITIIETGCSTEVLDIIKGQKDNIGLILLDIYLPNCDGWTLASMIQQLDSKIPLIAVSASPPVDMELKYRNAGFKGYISKPFDIEQLRQIIYSYLHNPL